MPTVISVIPPFSTFADVDGDPLESGYIYVGVEGLNPLIGANQIQVYSDADLTIPVAQPIRTLGGYPVASGTPIRMYGGANNYSILVQNKNGTLVYSSLSNEPKFGVIDFSGVQYDTTDAETTAGVVPLDKSIPSHDVIGKFLIARYGGGPAATATQNVSAINNASLVAVAAGGGEVIFPEGELDYDAQLVPKDFVFWTGAGIDATILNYTGVGVSIKGAGADTNNRKRMTISRMTIKGINSANNTAQGIDLGWNMRSTPLMDVKITGFPHYGIAFVDQNWIIKLQNVLVENCGHTANNSAGVWKDPAIDFSTWNEIIFDYVVVEDCGNASSASGGFNLQTTTATRGVYLVNCGVESNKGTSESLFSNTADLEIINMYMERVNVAGQQIGLEFVGCSGRVAGGYITGEGANNLYGLKFSTNSDMQVDGVRLPTWATASIQVQGSKIRTGRLFGATVEIDANAQVSGAIHPAFSARKNANQGGIVSGVFTKVSFQTEDYDILGSYDNAVNFRFTPQTLGRYLLNVSVAWDDVQTANDQFIVAIYRNGALAFLETEYQTMTEPFAQTVNKIVRVTATNDYFEVFVRHLGAANRQINQDDSATYFCAELLEAAQ